MRFVSMLLMLLTAACASNNANIIRPAIEIVEISGPNSQYSPRGQNTMDAQYGFLITNRSDQTITLRHAHMITVGQGGYYMRPEDRAFDQAIPPGETGQATMYAKIYYTTGPLGDASNEPVSIRATLSFDSPTGKFQQIVMQNLSQFPNH